MQEVTLFNYISNTDEIGLPKQPQAPLKAVKRTGKVKGSEGLGSMKMNAWLFSNCKSLLHGESSSVKFLRKDVYTLSSDDSEVDKS